MLESIRLKVGAMLEQIHLYSLYKSKQKLFTDLQFSMDERRMHRRMLKETSRAVWGGVEGIIVIEKQQNSSKTII